MNYFDILFAKYKFEKDHPPVIKRATGNPIILTDAADAPLVECVTQITGSQDLHGQDKPWVGGAGKNKFNKDATYTGTTVIIEDNSLKFAVLAQGQTVHYNEEPLYIADKTVTISATTNGSLPRIYFRLRKLDDSGWMTNEDASISGLSYNSYYGGWFSEVTFPVTYAIPNCLYANFGIGCNSSTNVGLGNLYVFSNVQIESGSQATSYVPYSNICPITAYTEGEIEVRGKNLLPNKMFQYNTYNVFIGKDQGGSDKWLKPGTYTLQIDCTNTSYHINYGVNGGSAIVFQDVAPSKWTFTVTEKSRYRFWLNSEAGITVAQVKNFQLVEGSESLPYEPYTSTTNTTTYPSAIYRGSEDVVNGSVTVNRVKWTKNTSTMNNSENYPGWANSGISELLGHGINRGFTNVTMNIGDTYNVNTTGALDILFLPKEVYGLNQTEWKALAIDVEIIVELATPTTSSVTPTNLPIKSLLGYNHIESSTGELDITYLTQNYQNFVDIIENNFENNLRTRKGGIKPLDVFRTLEVNKEPEEEEKKDEKVEDVKK